jgi:hypothetical protein
MVQDKEILYPFFLDCAVHCKDLFWLKIFEELSCGRCPYGSYVSKEFICCKYKNREFSYKIEKKDSVLLYNEIYDLFTNKLGVMSCNDKLQKRANFNVTETLLKDSRKSWNTIRKKNIKDILLKKFVISMSQEFDLSKKQSQYLLSLLYLSIVFKIISQKDINFVNGKIISINGFSFDKGEVIYNKSLFCFNSNRPAYVIFDRYSMIDYLETNRR